MSCVTQAALNVPLTTVDGYHRLDGRVGTANVWLVVPLVFCENRNIEVLRQCASAPVRQCVADALRDDPFQDYKCMARQLWHGESAAESAVPSGERLFPQRSGSNGAQLGLPEGADHHAAKCYCRA